MRVVATREKRVASVDGVRADGTDTAERKSPAPASAGTHHAQFGSKSNVTRGSHEWTASIP